ncbi:MAG TPA: acetyl-CoA hydrolase/transferase C-terminal domain-containing protein [Actinomycetales bacterium]|nr:acetyl-CoA hydrolase/transferase C-terminal domain-containing protein [Actinomycetales bacterium]
MTGDDARVTTLLQARAGAGHGVPRVVASGNDSVPWRLLELVDGALARYALHMLNAPTGIPTRDGVVHETCFVGAGMRRSPALSYVPARLSLVPRLFATTLPPDVVCLHVSRPRDGMVSMGAEVNVLPAAVEACRARGGLVLAQVNPWMPYTFGDGEIPLDQLDAVIEADQVLGGSHAATRPGQVPAPADDAAAVIGDLVAARVHDGATLQLGIGAVPDATLPGLSARRHLGVWSEMVSDGLLALREAGALDAERHVVASFVVGSPELYAYLDQNPGVRILRTETTNAPAAIAANPAMTSINTALQVDLFGQANASRINARIHSGFGGQTDFIVGAIHSPGGQAIMALRSWHPKADVSTIVPLIDEPVTSFQHTAVVTEQGVAPIFGHDERTQARHLIDHAAHPDVRDELREEAAELGLLA